MSISGPTDFSFAFMGAAYNSYSSAASLAANQALARVRQKAGANTAASATTTADQRLSAAKSAGQAVLASLGIGGSAYAATLAKTTNSTAAGPYRAPTNSSTGYSYVTTSSASLNAIASLNIFA